MQHNAKIALLRHAFALGTLLIAVKIPIHGRILHTDNHGAASENRIRTLFHSAYKWNGLEISRLMGANGVDPFNCSDPDLCP